VVKIPRLGGYARLLEILLGGNLSSPEDIYQSLRDFFSSLRPEASDQTDKLSLSLAKSIGEGLVECLSSSNYKAVMRAAKALRVYANSVRDIPDNCIPALIGVLDKGPMSSAKEAALTLGCLACTTPPIYLQPPNISVGTDAGGKLQCLGCEGGYLRGENAGIIVPALIRNLDKSTSKSGSLRVRQACMVALGEIGYTRPDCISAASHSLNRCLNEREMRCVSIFVVGCIGYSRPDLVEDLVSDLRKVAEGREIGSLTAIYALKRIGRGRKS
jgi:hypothetical protein